MLKAVVKNMWGGDGDASDGSDDDDSSDGEDDSSDDEDTSEDDGEKTTMIEKVRVSVGRGGWVFESVSVFDHSLQYLAQS